MGLLGPSLCGKFINHFFRGSFQIFLWGFLQVGRAETEILRGEAEGDLKMPGRCPPSLFHFKNKANTILIIKPYNSLCSLSAELPK